MASFVDKAQVHVKAGDGGAGSISFRREAHVDKGGPDGGDGGDGGSLYLIATQDMVSLLSFVDQPFRRASSGVHGMGKARHGHRGKDVEIAVPVGTVVKNPDGVVVADLRDVGSKFLAGKGGQGGRGNMRFLANRRRAPSFAEQGEVGEEFWYDLELKLCADVAIVGFPNVGKSTLISVVSRAKPKIADYPFTTLKPNLGVVQVGDSRNTTEFVIADIPGLIEGASQGRGLGFEFLRHIERARIILYLLDGTESGGKSVAEQLDLLQTELGLYMPEMLERQSITVISKADCLDHEVVENASKLFNVTPDFVISSQSHLNIEAMVSKLAEMVSSTRQSDVVVLSTEAIVINLGREGFKIERESEHSFRVRGRSAERAVALSDVTSSDSLEYIHTRLRHLGVDRALVRAGATDGDEVSIGKFTFDYVRD